MEVSDHVDDAFALDDAFAIESELAGDGEFVVEPGRLLGFGQMAYFPAPSGRYGEREALAALAAKAAPENWDDDSQPRGRLPVLYNYLQYTFRRLHAEGKLVESVDVAAHAMAFNTGLYTTTWQAIYGCFGRNRNTGKQPWVFSGWHTEDEGPMKPFVGCEPQRAQYFTDPRALLFDPSLKFVEGVTHMLNHHVDRYPPELQADAFRRHQALTFGVGVAKKMVEQNWQVAVPMYYFAQVPGQDPISLLLPLCLIEPGKADMALVVGRYGEQYKAFTVLTLEQAYRSARLIAKPAAAWLGHAAAADLGPSASWRRVTGNDCCPVCGQTTRCVMAADNRSVICVRVSDGGQPLPQRTGAWEHKIVPIRALSDRSLGRGAGAEESAR